LPFTLVYLFEQDGTARLACSTGISPGHRWAPLMLGPEDNLWPVTRILTGEPSVAFDLVGTEGLPTGAWDRPPTAAIVIPLARQGAERPAGFMVAGLNPYRPSDPDYLGFINLVAGQIASSLANAEAHERLAAEVQERTAERDRLRNLFQQAPGFMCLVLGPDHVFDLTNESYLQLVGHRDLIGKPIREALPEIQGQGFFELLTRVYEEGEPFVGRSQRVMIQRRPGAPLEERILDFVYQPIFGDDGRTMGIFAEGSDITDRVLAETALREL
jgi:PAS domain S-box-containing protein